MAPRFSNRDIQSSMIPTPSGGCSLKDMGSDGPTLRVDYQDMKHRGAMVCDEMKDRTPTKPRRRMEIQRDGQLQPSKYQRSKKRVHFDRSPTQTIPREQQDLEATTSSLWYVSEDYKGFRRSYLQDAKRIASNNSVSDSILIRTFELCCKGENQLSPVMAEELRFYLQDPANIGLERMAARKIFQDKKYRRCSLLDTILELQQRHNKNEERKASALRFASESINFSSVLFAHQLALAVAEIQ